MMLWGQLGTLLEKKCSQGLSEIMQAADAMQGSLDIILGHSGY